MKTVAIIFIVSMLYFSFPNLSYEEEKTINDSTALVTLGHHTIIVDEFWDLIILYRKGKDTEKLISTLTPAGKEEILKELIDIKLFALLAKEKGLDHEPSIRRLIETSVNSLLAQSLITQEVKKLILSDDSLLHYYKTHRNEFMTDRRVKARHIITKTKEEAEVALFEVKRGKSFSQIASEKNIDATKPKGGDLDWIKRGVMVKPFEEALFSLKSGEISGVVKTNFGFHIIKVEEIDEGKVNPFETVKEDVRKRMIENRISEMRNELKEKYPIKINRRLLEEIGKR
jgi:peptidyl-prolyl cis-trans isomerase C